MGKYQTKASYWQDAPLPRDQLALFSTSLEDRIPSDHPVRLLDEILDRLSWQQWEATYHGERGQPPIHPSILCKILLFAMIRGIRSSRQIEYNLKHSVDFIWLASGRTIDHTTLSEFRRKHQAELKGLYRDMVKLAVELKVAKLAELCIDGTRVQADANKYRTWTVEKAEKLLQELDGRIENALAELETNDQLDDLFDTGEKSDELPEELRDMQARRTQLDEVIKKLADMEETRAKWGADSKKNPAQLPKADTDSRILPNKEGGYAPNYTPMIVTETDNGFIVGADVVIGNVEHHQLTTLIDTIVSDYDVDVARVLADTAYTTGENLSEMEARDVEMLGPLADPKCSDNPAHREDLTQPVEEAALDKLPVNPQTKRFDKSAFVYDAESDCYYCPAGEPMTRPEPRHRDEDGAPIEPKTKTYTSHGCAACNLASRCRANLEAGGGRQINDDIHEPARRRHRERMNQEESKIDYGKRFHYGEVPFAVLKAVMGFRRFLLRGEAGVQTEWLWACTGYNLKKLIRLWPAICADTNENEKMTVA
jgi:transposase